MALASPKCWSLSLLKDRTPELYENAMAMLNLCEAAMAPGLLVLGWVFVNGIRENHEMNMTRTPNKVMFMSPEEHAFNAPSLHSGHLRVLRVFMGHILFAKRPRIHSKMKRR